MIFPFPILIPVYLYPPYTPKNSSNGLGKPPFLCVQTKGLGIFLVLFQFIIPNIPIICPCPIIFALYLHNIPIYIVILVAT